MPPPKLTIQRPHDPFDEIEAYINQLPKDIPKLEDINIFKSTKGLQNGAYGQAYANETHVMKMIDLEHQIKITRHNSYLELIEKITSSIQSEIVYYHEISNVCPNVCKMLGYSYDSANHKLYIYMENCGIDLFNVYRVFRSPKTTRHYIGQIISAIDCLHQNGFVHRDLKPENITVTREGIIQLIDFGTARRDGDIAFELGTPGYKSPENMRQGPLTFDMLKASDIWSLGATFMFMLLPHALTSTRGPILKNEFMNKLFVNNPTNGPLTFVQRIEQLFTPKDGIFIMTTCYKEIINIFGLSATWESFFSDDWTKRASVEQLKTWFDNKLAEQVSTTTTSKGGKSRRKKRGSKHFFFKKSDGAMRIFNAQRSKKTRSSRK